MKNANTYNMSDCVNSVTDKSVPQVNGAAEIHVESLPPHDQGQQTVDSLSYRKSLPTARIFVRIPTNAFETQEPVQLHLQPRDLNNQGEIKSEPIKFELSEGISTENTTAVALPHTEASNDTDPTLITARPKKSSKCVRCTQCLFATIFEERLNEHLTATHTETVNQNESGLSNPSNRKTRKCPACTNEFVARKSLEIHLELDHQMPMTEIQSLLEERGNDCQPEASIEKPRANRIFIKSVDVLRQPETISDSSNTVQPYTTSFPPLESMESSNTIFMDLIDAGSPANMVVAPSETLQDSCSSDAFTTAANELHPPPPSNSSNPRRKAKIYIKNVDILKEPIFVPPIPAFQSNILNVNDNLNLELFPLSNEPPASLDIYDFNTNTIHSSSSSRENDISEPSATDATPKKPPNALHLRTVDELNLMNMKEVQNLLAPLPEQNGNTNHQNHQTMVVPSSENSKSSDEVLLLNSGTPYSIPDFPYNQDNSFNLSEAEFMPGNWSSYYNFDDLEANSLAAKAQNDNLQNSTHFDLNTPQQVVAEENDEDILFVCAQELINDSEGLANSEKHSNALQFLPLDKDQVSSDDGGVRLGEIVEIEDDMEQQANGDIRIYNEVEIIAAAKDVEKRDALIPEKGRIYVADNLMEDRSDRTANEASRRGRGRLFGSRQIGITKLKKTFKNSTAEDFGYHRCDQDCAYRFRDIAKLEYHKRCHTSSQQRMQCPECNQSDFTSWNTLHTHLWRQHKIDMELYSCEYCSFKTPMLSRLMNTHIKIHSDERNFKCSECNKAFKNSKQLKDHRRVHRLANQPNQEAFVCPECSSSFGHLKSLKEHVKKKHTNGDSASTDGTSSINKSQKAGSDGISPKLQCDKCSHTTNDHNAMRRHKMTHDNSKRYQCQFCDYSCIQSTLYQKHIQLKHPEQAADIILKCSHCSFATINRRYYDVHIVKHRNNVVSEPNALVCDSVDDALENRIDDPDDHHTTMVLTSIFNSNLEDEIYQPVEISNLEASRHFDNVNNMEILPLERSNIHYEVDTRHKIKVKSDSVLTDPSKFCTLEPITLPHLQIL